MFLKLVNAEEVMANVVSQTSTHIRIQDPARVLCSANLDGTLSLVFIPWNLLGKFEELILEADKVVISMEASDKAKKLYAQYWKAQRKKEEFLRQDERDKNMAYDLMMIEPGGTLKH